jgi:hypothetical protein
MGLSLGLGLCMLQTQSHRETLEQKLRQALKQRHYQKLELCQYQTLQDRLVALYREARDRGDVRNFDRHGLAFEYARIHREEVPDLAEMLGCGFAHCRLDFLGIGAPKWMLFVIPDFFAPLQMPETYVEYVAVHEHGVAITMGMHELATLLEFAIAKKERRLGAYLGWLEQNYSAKFTDVFSQHRHVLVPEDRDLQNLMEVSCSGEYALQVRKMIKEFEWPFKALQKLCRYAKSNLDSRPTQT